MGIENGEGRVEEGRRGRGMQRRGEDELVNAGDKCVWEGHKIRVIVLFKIVSPAKFFRKSVKLYVQ